ncbi:MAG TPA: hypothetical protein VN193_05525 [Candidatus Angelobacter sp.]|jgi:hypothetical protein|nr:hypothetical protein [Candidatus Angelobacter sp.]
MNLFTGFTDRQIISAVLMFALFNLFAICEAGALTAFYISSRPARGGRVRTGSLLYIAAALIFMISVVSTVWAAPAEKSFVDPNGTMFAGDGFTKVIVGLIIMVVGLVVMLAGAVVTAGQKREAQRQSLVSG